MPVMAANNYEPGRVADGPGRKAQGYKGVGLIGGSDVGLIRGSDGALDHHETQDQLQGRITKFVSDCCEPKEAASLTTQKLLDAFNAQTEEKVSLARFCKPVMPVMVANNYEPGRVANGPGCKAQGYKGVGLIGGSDGALDRIFYEAQDQLQGRIAKFVSDCCEPKEAASLTTQELLDAFNAQTQEKVSLTIFCKPMMPVMVANNYEPGRVANGPGRQSQGYKGVGLIEGSNVGLIGGSNGALDRIYETQDQLQGRIAKFVSDCCEPKNAAFLPTQQLLDAFNAQTEQKVSLAIFCLPVVPVMAASRYGPGRASTGTGLRVRGFKGVGLIQRCK